MPLKVCCKRRESFSTMHSVVARDGNGIVEAINTYALFYVYDNVDKWIKQTAFVVENCQQHSLIYGAYRANIFPSLPRACPLPRPNTHMHAVHTHTCTHRLGFLSNPHVHILPLPLFCSMHSAITLCLPFYIISPRLTFIGSEPRRKHDNCFQC